MSSCLQDESWMSVQIPLQFSDIIKGIIASPNKNNTSTLTPSHNLSLTILNSSNPNNISHNNLSKISATDYSEPCSINFKILKNNILVDGQRYRLTMSFLLLCEFFEEYVTVCRTFMGLFRDETKQSKKLVNEVYDSLFRLADAWVQ